MQPNIKQRDTKQRRMVYDAVMKHKDHPNAEQIYQDVRAQDARVSKATVYRNLKMLYEKGNILQVKASGADRFDSTLGDHYHVVCTICGRMIDAPIGYLFELNQVVDEQTGFAVLRHDMVFEGVCPECQKASVSVLTDAEDKAL